LAKTLHLFCAPKRHAPMEELSTARAVFEPSELMETIRPGLQQELQGRRGMLCRVLSGGALQRGDAIILQAPRDKSHAGVES
jgi:MOSC domain-containing protein YiiM